MNNPFPDELLDRFDLGHPTIRVHGGFVSKTIDTMKEEEKGRRTWICGSRYQELLHEVIVGVQDKSTCVLSALP